MTHATTALTPRQRGVAALIAAGRTNAEIGWELGLSTQTVKNHVSQILQRLDMTSRVSVAVWASQQNEPMPIADDGSPPCAHDWDERWSPRPVRTMRPPTTRGRPMGNGGRQ